MTTDERKQRLIAVGIEGAALATIGEAIMKADLGDHPPVDPDKLWEAARCFALKIVQEMFPALKVGEDA